MRNGIFTLLLCLLLVQSASADLLTENRKPQPIQTLEQEWTQAAAEYEVTVDGTPIHLYPAMDEHWSGKYYFGAFEISGTAKTIRVKSSKSLQNVKILPERFGLSVQSEGENEISFTAAKPFRIAIEREGKQTPLLLFANPPEKYAPKADDPNVLYFAPGIHKGQDLIKVTSGQTLYLAEGAILHAGILAEGNDIKICGRGILAGESYERFKGPGHQIHAVGCKNLEIRDIIIRNPWSWSLVTRNCDGVMIENVKICASRMINDDAVDLCNTRNAVIRDCFLRSQDDCIAIKGMSQTNPMPCENILVEDCEFWTDKANIYRIGYECDAEAMRNIVSKNIDVLHYSIDDRPSTNYWANTIFWLQPSNGMPMSNIHFEDIRIYSDGSNTIFLMAKSMCCGCGQRTYTEGGSLSTCTFKNISVYGEQGNFFGELFFSGMNETASVKNMTFENVTIFGKPIDRASPQVKITDFVSEIEFK